MNPVERLDHEKLKKVNYHTHILEPTRILECWKIFFGKIYHTASSFLHRWNFKCSKCHVLADFLSNMKRLQGNLIVSISVSYYSLERDRRDNIFEFPDLWSRTFYSLKTRTGPKISDFFTLTRTHTHYRRVHFGTINQNDPLRHWNEMK